MATQASFTVKTWNEETTSEVDGRLKITRAVVTFVYSGDLEGEGAMQYLMLYRHDGSADAIGLERFTGKLGGKSGTFALRHRGGYANGTFSGEFDIVDGSASGELQGLRGSGTAIAHQDGTAAITIDYVLN